MPYNEEAVTSGIARSATFIFLSVPAMAEMTSLLRF
jgi:hypothetical protein